MALRVDLETPTWRYRSWSGPVRGLLSALIGSLGTLVLVGLVLEIDGTANAQHYDTFQSLTIVLATAVGLVGGVFTAVFSLAICSADVVASSGSGLLIVGRNTIPIPWGVLRDVRLETHRGWVTPVLSLRSGGVIRIARARSRVSAATVSAIEAALGNPDTDGLPGRKAIEIARALRGQLRETGGLVAAPSAPAMSQISPFGSDLPGTPSFRMRSPKLSSRQFWRLWATTAFSIPLAVAGGEGRSGHPFSWHLLFVATGAGWVGIAAVVLSIMFASTAEMAIGPNWIAARRWFHRKWTVVSFDKLVSVTRRTSQSRARRGRIAMADALVLREESLRRVVVGSFMLRSGAGAVLQTQLVDNPAMLPSARGLLTGSSVVPAGPIPSIAQSTVRRNGLYGRAWGALLSVVLISVAAAAVGAAHHALWVSGLAVVAVAPLVWAVVQLRRQRRSGTVLISADVFHSQNLAPKKTRLFLAMSFGQLAMIATVASATVVSRSSSVSASFEIAGAPGYFTYSGQSGAPLEEGEPWGTPCHPIVFVAKHLPEFFYGEAQIVLAEALGGHLDVTIDNNDGTWYPQELRPPNPTAAEVTLVPIFPDATSTPKLADGKPEHIAFGWDARPSSNGSHERLVDLQATLYLKNIGSNRIAAGRSIRQLIAFAEGVSDTTVSGSAISAGGTTGFTQQDMNAMHLMSGCPG
jgi:hypothetical protein